MRVAGLLYVVATAAVLGADTPIDSGAAVEHAQQSLIATDRPGFMDSPLIVPVGVAQLEIGSAFFSAQNDRSLTLGGELLRIGFTNRIELRVSNDGYLRPASGRGASGWSGGSVGAKLKLTDERRWLPNLSLVPSLSLSYGQACCASKTYSRTLKLSWTKCAPSGFGIGGNFNVASLHDDAGRYRQHAASIAVDHSLGAFSAFVETYAYDRADRGRRIQAYVDGGLSRKLGRDLQVDVSVGHSVTSTRPEWFVAVGVSMRRTVGAVFSSR
jgi:hypothetical protein